MKDTDTQFSKICFKKLSPQRKLEYLWDYYKFHLFAILALSTIIISSIFILRQNAKPTLLNGYLLNADWGDEQAKELLQEYAACRGYNLDEYNAYFNSSVFIDTAIKDQMSTVAYTKVMSDFDVKKIDFFFCNREMLDYFGEREIFLNLENAMPQNLYQRFEKQMITTDALNATQNNTPAYACGIDISNSPVLKRLQQQKNMYEDQSVFLAVPYNSQHPEQVWDFLQFLYSED